MKLIKLTQGKFAKVDDTDYAWLNQFKWCATKDKRNNVYYASRIEYEPGGKGKIKRTIKMHRLILNLTDPKIEGEHMNHDGLDCQRHNIRKSTHSQNCMNRRAHKNSTSKYLGVHWDKESKKWKAAIKVNGKSHNLGRYINELDAAKAYNIGSLKYCGEFANLNKI